MLIRAQEFGRPFGACFIRRMLALFIFGLVHLTFLWGGDILTTYAFTGLYLLAFVYLLRRQRLSKYNTPSIYLKTGATFILLPFVFGIIGGLTYGSSHDNRKVTEAWQESKEVIVKSDALINKAKAEGTFLLTKQQYDALNKQEKITEKEQADKGVSELTIEKNNKVSEASSQLQRDNGDTQTKNVLGEEKVFEQTQKDRIEQQVKERFEREQMNYYHSKNEANIFTHGSWMEVTLYRLDKIWRVLGIAHIFSLFICLPIFMIGYWLVASGRMKAPEQHKIFFNALCYGGLFFGLTLNLAGVFIILHPAVKDVFELHAVGFNIFFLGQYVLMFGYFGLLVKLYAASWFKKYFAWLIPLGKMAMTNYITHSIILTSIFYGYAGGMFGEIDRAIQIIIAVAIIVCQAIFSFVWLKFYKFGPLEWLCRSITYIQWQPMRK